LGGEMPFGLARRLFEPAIRAAPSLLEAGWARHARPLFEGEAGGAGDRRSLIEGLVALVAEIRRAGASPVLTVDDAQWGDSASLEFLEELGARCEDIGVAIAVAVATGQGAFEAAPLRRLAQAADDWMLAPAPLSAGAVRDLVCERVPGAG